MWSNNNAKCLVQGHVSSSFMYKGEEYTYCVRCGKISLNHLTGSVDYPEYKSRHSTGEQSGTISITNL